jgi:hypothetical protein
VMIRRAAKRPSFYLRRRLPWRNAVSGELSGFCGSKFDGNATLCSVRLFVL